MNQGSRKTHIWEMAQDALGFLAMAGVFLLGWISLYGKTFESWYLREDSRFFNTVPYFSLYDLWTWFSTPFNGMGQYRPMTQVYWAVPRFFSLFDPRFYHCITLFLLFGAGSFLGLICWELFRRKFWALACGASYCLLTTHLKPLLWLSAWHNTSCAFFAAGTLWLRLRYWKKESRAIDNILFFLAFYCLLASNNTTLPWIVVLFLVDIVFASTKRWYLHSLQYLVPAFLLSIYLYVLHRPEQIVSAGRGLLSVLSLKASAIALAAYFYSLFGNSVGDGVLPLEELNRWQITWGSFLLLGIGILSYQSLKQRVFLLPLAMALCGILMNVVYSEIWNAEYPTMMALGIFLVIPALFSTLPQTRVGDFIGPFLFLALTYLTQAHTLSKFYIPDYLTEGQALRTFILQLKELDSRLPAYESVYVQSARALNEKAIRSEHWLAEGVEELFPERYVFFRQEAFSTRQTFQEHDPEGKIWKEEYLRPLPSFHTVDYKESGFQGGK